MKLDDATAALAASAAKGLKGAQVAENLPVPTHPLPSPEGPASDRDTRSKAEKDREIFG